MKNETANRKTDFRKFDDLSPENRESAVQMADDVLKEHGIDSEKREALRVVLEKVLEAYSEKDEKAPLRIITHRTYKRIDIRVFVRCASYEPNEIVDSISIDEVLKVMDTPPEWKYHQGNNVLVYSSKTPVPGLQALGQLSRYMEKEKKAFRIGVALRFVNMLLLVAEPLLAAGIVTAFNASSLEKILLYAVLMALVEAASGLLTYVASLNLTKAYTTMRDEMQTELAKSVLEIKTENIDAHSSGVFIQRIMDETGNLVLGIDQMLNVVTELFRLLALLVAFALVSVPMLGFEIVLFLVYFLIVRAQAKKLNEDNRRQRNAKEDLNSIVTEMVKASRDIKLLRCEESFTAKTKEVISAYTGRTQDVENHNNTYLFARAQFVAWTDLFYLALLVLLMKAYGMTAATALVLYNYNGKAFVSARAVSTATEHIYDLLLAAERVW